MPKLYCVSDIHSFYTPMKKALDEAGFDPNNKDHWLIVCGDCFDRGDESGLVLKFLMSLERKVLIKGNHDILFKSLVERGWPGRHDYQNGTLKTVYDLGDAESGNALDECFTVAWNKTAAYRDLLVNYFETKNYIFVHSWIPCYLQEKPNPADKWIPLTTDEWRDDWRTCDDFEWEEAMWGNPFKKWQEGLNKTGKTIVFGHWHCSTGHSIASGGQISEFEDDAIWEPFIHDNIIGIDRCTAYTGEINVLVLEDEFLES